MFPICHPEFVTVTCLEWKMLLSEDRHKRIITESMKFLVEKERLIVFGFVIMSNHFHAIWQANGQHKPADVRRDLLKYTSQQILENIRTSSPDVHRQLLVNAIDRKYQFWERNSLSIPLFTNRVFNQKLDYIHRNPVRAGLCQHP